MRPRVSISLSVGLSIRRLVTLTFYLKCAKTVDYNVFLSALKPYRILYHSAVYSFIYSFIHQKRSFTNSFKSARITHRLKLGLVLWLVIRTFFIVGLGLWWSVFTSLAISNNRFSKQRHCTFYKYANKRAQFPALSSKKERIFQVKNHYDARWS